MYEIDRKDQVRFGRYQERRDIYENAVYDFTFENRFVIYHAPLRNQNVYIAYDKKSGKSSEVCSRKEGTFGEYDYRLLIPQILYSIKYTGDRRHLRPYADSPESRIDLIFRSLLPKHGYKIREEQIRLSKEIYRGLTTKRVAICEAEVGTGKTMAYLVAALCARKTQHPLRNGSLPPVTIVTSSIELQTAIMKKEIPFLSYVLQEAQIMDRPLTAILRKGKEHYFCPVRFEDYTSRLMQCPEKYGKALEYFRRSEFADRAFDLDAVGIPAFVKSHLCVKGHCGKCKMRPTCAYSSFIVQALDKRNDLDIQVVNHNLYLMSRKIPSILRPSRFVVVDEAHKLKEAAQDVFGEQFSSQDVVKLLNWSRNLCSSKKQLEEYKALQNLIEKTNTALFAQIRRQAGLRLCDVNEPGGIASLSMKTLQLMDELSTELRQMGEMMQKNLGRQEIRISGICSSLAVFTTGVELNIWAAVDELGVTTLSCCPKDMGKTLRDSLWNSGASYALLSGTMSDGESFHFFKRENGLEVIPADEIMETTTGSPFDYGNHTRLYIPEDLPLPDNDDAGYLKAVSDRIVELVRATNGHTAILFTSYSLLHLVYDRTWERLQNFHLIRMGRNNKTAISEFRNSTNGVLFAAGSMWEGVDCAGDLLSSVIIVRLPFPLRSVAMEQKKENCQSVHEFVREYAVPEMLIKLRQGAGRLIRNESDTGLLSVLDGRACRGSPYRRQVLQALRKYPMVSSVQEAEAFLRTVKGEAYWKP